MAMKPPSESASKWQRNMNSSHETIRNGINRVEVAPGVKAAEAHEAWLAGIQRAYNEGKFSKNAAAVSLEDWRNATLEKGLNRLSQGVNAAVSDVEVFHEELAEYQSKYLPKLRSKQKITLADSEEIMLENMRQMSKFRRNRRR